MSHTETELQISSEIHQANRELAEERLRRLAEIEAELRKPSLCSDKFRALAAEKDAILAAAVAPV